MTEKQIWKGSPSQWKNLGYYVLCFLTCWLIVPIYLAIARFFKTKCTKYEITDQRIIVQTGVFSRKTDVLELYRVKDLRLEEPFFMRLFKLSNIILVTSDRTEDEEIIPAVKGGKEIREELRNAVDARRDAKRVREFD